MKKLIRVGLIALAVANLVACSSLPVKKYVVGAYLQGRR